MTQNRGESEKPKIRLTRMRIEKFRHVRPGTELTFNSGLNVLIGKNVTGKTTLLNLISMALRADFDEIDDEAFSVRYQLQYGVLTLDIAVENRKDQTPRGFLRKVRGTFQPRIEMSALYSDSGETAMATLEANVYRFDGFGRKVIEKENGAPWVTLPVDVEEMLAMADLPPEARIESERRHEDELWWLYDQHDLYWENRVRFDEALEFFKLIIDDDSDYVSSAECVVPGIARFVPKELSAAVEKFFADGDKTSFTLHDGGLPFLRHIAHALGFRGGRVQADLQKDDSEKKKKTVGGFNFYFKTADNTMVPIDELSFGQKRLFALLYYLSVNDQVAIVDEPTNGLHHEWIERCLSELGTRQTFVATQHPLLLDYLTFGSPEEVQGTFVQCRLEVDEDGNSAWLWSAMDEADAHRFFEAYQAGVQYISEILVSKGLW